MTHDKFKDIAAGIQSIVLAIAILAGGGWAVCELVAYKKAERAEAELEELRGKAYLDVDLDASQISGSSEGAKLVEVTILLENRGKQSLILRPGTIHTYLSRVKIAKEGSVDRRDTVHSRMGESTRKEALDMINQVGDGGNWMIQPGEKKKQLAVVAVPDPGLYHVRFVVRRGPEEREAFIALMEKADVEEEIGPYIYWSGEAHVSVK